jgi:mRNA-degrading endonuclease YafQ of YafQ-DinJ toxin-antitoxin module
MRGVNQAKQFRRDYERQKRRGKNIAKLEVVVVILAEEGRVGRK